MIERLCVEGLGLVERTLLEFGPGLNVLTGETGAGKSMVLGALALLAGARARPGDVREGAAEAVVEAVFRTERQPALEAALAERGFEAEEHELIVRRSVAREGRSRAWLGGRLVPVSALSELFGAGVEISSQHGSQGLLRPEQQGRLLDEHGGLLALRAEVEEGVAALRALDRELAELRATEEERARREDVLAFQIREIDEAGLDPAAVEDLEAEHRRLVHAERLRSEAEQAVLALRGDPAAPEAPGAAEALARSARRMTALAELDRALGGFAERLAAAAEEADDVAAELEHYAARAEADPERLQAVEEHIRQLERLKRKYGAGPAEILAFRERAAAELEAVGGSEARQVALAAERDATARRVVATARRLSQERRDAAAVLGSAAQEGIRGLAMPDARFEVALEPQEPPAGLPCGSAGHEAAVFLFSANPGEPLRPLRQVASGGELSRVFLALKNALRRAGAEMVLVFDEVDAGIGGAVAERVGAVLAELAARHQVLCITHLPQIAAQGAHHFRVEKAVRGGRSRTTVSRLEEPARVEEIARMAGGEEVAEATRRHARALLSRPTDRSGAGSRSRRRAGDGADGAEPTRGSRRVPSGPPPRGSG